MGASASKIKFRESLASLTARDVSPADTDFWDELWKIPSSSEEVFELLTPAAARRLRDDRFENLATLFTQATAQLCQIVETPYTIYFDQALNCVRVLTRVVPFLLERGDLGARDQDVAALCWGEGDGGDGGGKGGKRAGRGRGTGAGAGGNAADGGSDAAPDADGDPAQSVTVRESREEEDEVEITLDGNESEEEEDDDDESASDGSEGERDVTPKGSDDDDDDEEEEEEEDDNNEPLALLVVHAAMHMLFLPQFTCEFYEEDPHGPDGAASASDSDSDSASDSDPEAARSPRHHHPADEDADADASARLRRDRDAAAEAGLGRPRRAPGAGALRLAPRPAGIVWAPGVGFAPDGGRGAPRGRGAGGAPDGRGGGAPPPAPEAAYTRRYDKNRIEVLRLLLAACSDPLFSPADEYNPLASRWMAVAVAADAPNAPCLFYSLLNTVVSYDPHHALGGFSGGGLPHMGAFSADAHVQLVELSAQVLCVLLDCGLSGDPAPYENHRGEAVVPAKAAYGPGFNVFRVLLARIDGGRDLETLYRGFVRLLRNMHEGKNSLLAMPSAPTRLECHQELLILLWKTLEENPLFLDFILTRCDVCELVTPLCYLMYVSRKDSAQVGLIHICTFILLKLSGERSFGVSLNRPYRTKLPCDLPLFSGSHADLVSITLHKIIVNGSYRLVPLYSCFLTIVSNFSPYWRSMSLVASVKLVNLFELFSSPKFLYSSEKAYRHLALLLEIFNNIIQYQYNGNQHLVYAVLRRKDAFGRLASLTLDKAVHQCEKAFPAAQEPEYDADAEETADRVAALALEAVDEAGRPVDAGAGTDAGGDGAADGGAGGTARRRDVPRGRFVPTEAWMAEIKASLPLETVNRLLSHLVPVVDDMCRRKHGVVDESEILEVFENITMVGLLPVPHAIVIRKYQPNQYTSIWFTAFMWGVIFLRSQKPPIFDKECIELFQVSNEDGEGEDAQKK